MNTYALVYVTIAIFIARNILPETYPALLAAGFFIGASSVYLENFLKGA